MTSRERAGRLRVTQASRPGCSDLVTVSNQASVGTIAWRIRGEVQKPATYSQVRLCKPAVCITVGRARSRRGYNTRSDVTDSSRMRRRNHLRAWNGSWNGASDNLSAASAVSAIIGVIGAARACAGRGQAPRNAPLAGSTGRTAHRGVANHRWVMSQAAGVHERPSSPRSPAPALHGEPPRLAPSRAAPLSTASLLHTLLHPKPRKVLASRPERRCTPHDLPRARIRVSVPDGTHLATAIANAFSRARSLNTRVIRVAPVFLRHTLGWC